MADWLTIYRSQPNATSTADAVVSLCDGREVDGAVVPLDSEARREAVPVAEETVLFEAMRRGWAGVEVQLPSRERTRRWLAHAELRQRSPRLLDRHQEP